MKRNFRGKLGKAIVLVGVLTVFAAQVGYLLYLMLRGPYVSISPAIRVRVLVSLIGVFIGIAGFLLVPRRDRRESHGGYSEELGDADGLGDGGMEANCVREDGAEHEGKGKRLEAGTRGGTRLRKVVGIVLLALGALALVRTVMAFLGYRPVGIHQTFEGQYFDGLMLGISAALVIAGGLLSSRE